MTGQDNRRETGKRKLHSSTEPNQVDVDAALPRKPDPYGLTERTDETQEKTRQSDGVNPPRDPD